MNDQPAAFKGTYSDLKFIKSRKVCQVTIEIPIEEGQAFVSAMGTPDPSQETWLALARLDLPRQPEKPAEARTERQFVHRPFHELPYPQQAALKCADKGFQVFVSRFEIGSETTEEIVRRLCGVSSRSEIKEGASGARWVNLLREFEGQRT